MFVQDDCQFDLLLQWWVTTAKYAAYQSECSRVCQVLQKMAKGDKELIGRFTAVAYEHYASAGFDGFGAFMNALFA